MRESCNHSDWIYQGNVPTRKELDAIDRACRRWQRRHGERPACVYFKRMRYGKDGR